MGAWYKSRERTVKKLQRWILGVPNQPLLSIQENNSDAQVSVLSSGAWVYEGQEISPQMHHQLCNAFMDLDQKLFFGVTFRFLSVLFKSLNVMESKSEAQKKMYDRSGYQRNLNRRCCGVGLKEFVSIVVSMKPQELGMDEWVERVLAQMGSLQKDQMDWEGKYIPIRMELIKMFSSLKSEKKEFISNLLIDNPFMRMSELGN
jgi:hypothetical protein